MKSYIYELVRSSVNSNNYLFDLDFHKYSMKDFLHLIQRKENKYIKAKIKDKYVYLYYNRMLDIYDYWASMIAIINVGGIPILDYSFDRTNYIRIVYDTDEEKSIFRSLSLSNRFNRNSSCFVLHTSGTTDSSKLVLCNEKELCEKVLKDYRNFSFGNIASTSTGDSISGLTFCLLIPLLFNSNCYHFTKIDFYKLLNLNIDTLTLSQGNNQDIESFIDSYSFFNEMRLNKCFSLNCLNNIFLLGIKLQPEFISFLRSNFELKKDIFYNSYGSTETMGQICICNEKDFYPLYLGTESKSNRVVYSIDGKKFYYLFDSNHMLKDSLNVENVISLLPVCKSNDVKMDNYPVGHIVVDSYVTDDICLLCSDMIYLIDRDKGTIYNDLINQYIENVLNSMPTGLINYKFHCIDMDNYKLALYDYRVAFENQTEIYDLDEFFKKISSNYNIKIDKFVPIEFDKIRTNGLKKFSLNLIKKELEKIKYFLIENKYDGKGK